MNKHATSRSILNARATAATGVVFTDGNLAARMVTTALFYRLQTDFPNFTRQEFSSLTAGQPAVARTEALVDKLERYQFLDPAVGHGVFISAYHRLLEEILPAPVTDCKNLIRAVDLDSRKIADCRSTLDFSPHLIQGDFLSTDLEPADIIVANPPYIRQELLAARYKKQIVQTARDDWPELKIPARADLYVHFLLHAASLLNHGGVLVFVIPNGWLDNDYGAPLRELFRRELQLLEISEASHRRDFQVEVNTVVLTASRRKPEAKHKIIIRSGDQTESVAQSTLASTDLGWYGSFFRCPVWLRRAMAANENLVPLNAVVAIKTGIITGNNRKYYSERSGSGKLQAIRTPREIRAISFVEADARFWIKPDADQFSLRRAPLLWPDLRGGRHFVVWNRDGLPFEHTFYGLEPHDSGQVEALALILNSSWVWLMVEIFGRKNLGGGAIRLVKSDLSRLPVPRMNVDFSGLGNGILRRPIENWRTELGKSDRQELDRAVFDHLGMGDFMEDCRELLAELIIQREEKSKS